MNNLKLLCTFSHKHNLDVVLDTIFKQFIQLQKVFIFVNKENENEYYITFNIDVTINPRYEHYIAIHRKKDTNTLYSVNALNKIIINLNNGILDTKYQIDWLNYKDMLLLTKQNEVSRIQLELSDIID